MNSKRRLLATVAVSTLGTALGGTIKIRNVRAASAAKEVYPVHPIRIIATYEPGGTNDIMARLTARILSNAFGVGVSVENRPGASGTIGTNLVAHARADGYTLLAGTFGPITTAPALFSNLPYDPLKDFAPVTRLATVPNAIVVNPRSGVTTLTGFIAKARTSSKPLTFGMIYGSTPQFVIKQFELETGVTLLDVPYKSGTGAVKDLVGNRLDFYVDNVPALLPLIGSELITPLAIADRVRSRALPGVPTTVELGYPASVISAWHGVLAPSATPAPIVEQLARAIAAALNRREIRAQIEAQGGVVVADTPQRFAEFIRVEVPRWGQVARSSGIRASA